MFHFPILYKPSAGSIKWIGWSNMQKQMASTSMRQRPKQFNGHN